MPGGFATLLGGLPPQPRGPSAMARPVDWTAFQETGRSQIDALMKQAELLVPRAQAHDPEAKAHLDMLMNRIDQIEAQEHEAQSRKKQKGITTGLSGSEVEEYERKKSMRAPPVVPGTALP